MKKIIDLLLPVLKDTFKYFLAALLSALGLASLQSCTVSYKCTADVEHLYVSPNKLCDSITFDNRLNSVDIRNDTLMTDIERSIEAQSTIQDALKYLKDIGVRILGSTNK